ncbi:MAG: type 2 isopentenyl-diphosphate Delta-isomerase [Thermofilum sp.]
MSRAAPMSISTRKDDHVLLSVKERVTSSATTLLEDVIFVHHTIPRCALADISLESDFLGKAVSAPVMISGMTGGSPLAEKINRSLAAVAQKLKIPLGVGSQRAALVDRELARTFSVVRDVAPDIPVVANIGASQVSRGLSASQVLELVEMVRADALAVHLNPLQEALQPEGEPDMRSFIENLRQLARESPVPVLLKQTGEGFSREAALMVKGLVKGIDVGGAGGTSFAVIEGLRARLRGLDELEEMASTFASWGIPTAASILEVRSALPDIFLIASGGLTTGVDVAKALRLGADFAGIARPVLLKLYYGGEQAAERYLRRVVSELRVAVFLTGSCSLEELRKAPVIVKGLLKEWVLQRGLEIPRGAGYG